MSTVIQASTEIDLEDAAVARKKPESSTDRELVSVAFLGLSPLV
jgi:putative transposase